MNEIPPIGLNNFKQFYNKLVYN